MPTNTWIASSAGDASTDANWSLGRAPIAGDDVQFTAVSANNCNWNIDVACSITLSGYTGIVLFANDLTNIVSINQADTSGNINGNSKNITASGNITIRQVNTAAPYNITMTSDGSTFYYSGSQAARNLIAAANITATRLFGFSLTTNAGKKLTLSGSSNTFEQHLSNSYNITNSGSIDGDGTLRLLIRNTKTLDLGDISCPVKIVGYSGSSSDYTASLGSNTRVKNNLTVISENSTYGVTLHHGSNYTLEVDGLTTLGARATMTQGTGQWTFTGGFTQNGASSQFTQGGIVHIYSGFSISSGTTTGPSNYSYPIILHSCNFTQSGGTVTGTSVSIKTYGNCTVTSSNTLLAIMVTSGSVCTKNYNNTISSRIETESGGELVLNYDTELRYYSASTLVNLGRISGAGKTLQFNLYDANKTIVLGDIGCNISVKSINIATADRTLSLADNATMSGSASVTSDHATYTCTLNLNGKNLTASNVTVGTRGNVLWGSGVHHIGGNLDTSAGSSDFGTSQIVMTGNGTIKTAAGQTLYDLMAEAPIALGSNITINGLFAHVGDVAQGAYSITMNRPEDEYSGLRRPIAKAIRQNRTMGLAAYPLMADLERAG